MNHATAHQEVEMGIGISIFFVAVGAILTFAVNAEAEGFNINTVGVILMIVGGLGLLVTTMIFGGRGEMHEHH